MVSWAKITQPRRRGLGVRTARNQNVALLGKLVWDLLHSPHKLWVSILKAFYVKDGDFFKAYSRKGSLVWVSITKAFVELKDGFECKAENGNSIFWFDSWAMKSLLCDVVFAVDIHDVEL